MHRSNPQIVQWAKLIGRTPSALAMKLSNFASLDPAITSTGRRGLSNASAADRAIWDEMQSDWERFAVEADEAASSFGIPTDPGGEIAADTGEGVDYTGLTKQAQALVRLGQRFFRRAVLSAYDYRCCITGLPVPTLLVASHIVPWRVDAVNRLNPRNGLCLSSLHDRAFDAGIITVSRELTVSVSPALTPDGDPFFHSTIAAYDGKPIRLPSKFEPDETFLSYHREEIYKG